MTIRGEEQNPAPKAIWTSDGHNEGNLTLESYVPIVLSF